MVLNWLVTWKRSGVIRANCKPFYFCFINFQQFAIAGHYQESSALLLRYIIPVNRLVVQYFWQLGVSLSLNIENMIRFGFVILCIAGLSKTFVTDRLLLNDYDRSLNRNEYKEPIPGSWSSYEQHLDHFDDSNSGQFDQVRNLLVPKMSVVEYVSSSMSSGSTPSLDFTEKEARYSSCWAARRSSANPSFHTPWLWT